MTRSTTPAGPTIPILHPNHPNWFRSGGLYGRRWPGYCTASFSPYFFGSPGQSTVGPDCKPWPRILKGPQTLVHPFRPVCYYYDQGTYVPVYDLDPLAPGPGPRSELVPLLPEGPARRLTEIGDRLPG